MNDEAQLELLRQAALAVVRVKGHPVSTQYEFAREVWKVWWAAREELKGK